MEPPTSSQDVATHATAPNHFEHIFIVTGPAGCGKTTVAQFAANNVNAPYIEGDDVSSLLRSPVPS